MKLNLGKMFKSLDLRDDDYEDYDEDEDYEEDDSQEEQDDYRDRSEKIKPSPRKKSSTYYSDPEPTPMQTGFSSFSRASEDTYDFSAKKRSTASRSSSGSRTSDRLVPLSSSRENKIFVVQPMDDTECWTIIDRLKEGKTIIINLEGLNVKVAQHIIDIISGCIYTIGGSIKCISQSIIIATPANTEVDGDLFQESLNSEGLGVSLNLHADTDYS